jgi:hypothetical protein
MNKLKLDRIAAIITYIDLIKKHYPNAFEYLGKPSQLDLTRREFFYWTEKGVINIQKPEKGQSPWNRLNLFEIIWIRIVKELRVFNIPFSSIVELKKYLLGFVFAQLKDEKEKLISDCKKKYSDENLINYINQFIDLSSEENHNLPKEFNWILSMLGIVIAEIFFHGCNINLIIYKRENEFVFTIKGFKNQELHQKELEALNKSTHLVLNLKSIVSEYLMIPELEILNEKFGFITDEEKELIKVIRNKQVKEINIKKDENEVLTYTATSKKEIDEQVLLIKKLLRMNEYDEVRVVFRNDKHLYIENKKKVKIRPVDTAQKKNKKRI